MRFKSGVEVNEGQDTAGAERPSGVQKQSSDLNLGLRAGIRLPVGAPRAAGGGCNQVSGLRRCSLARPLGLFPPNDTCCKRITSSLPVSVSQEPPPPTPAKQARPCGIQRRDYLAPGLPELVCIDMETSYLPGSQTMRYLSHPREASVPSL